MSSSSRTPFRTAVYQPLSTKGQLSLLLMAAKDNPGDGLNNGVLVHRVVLLPELIDKILQHTPQKSTLYAAALVCRLWSHFALDWLWRCIPFGVIGRLRDLMWRAYPSPGSDGKYPEELLLQEIVTSEGWERFRFYEQRVQKLSLKSMELYTPGPMGVPPYFSPKLMETPLLTNVRHLTFIAEEPTLDLHLVLQPITPSIEYLEIVAEDGYWDLDYRPVLDGEAFNNLVDTLVVRPMPKLKHFGFSAYLHEIDWHTLARLIGSLRGLKSLNLSKIPLNELVLEALFQLPELRACDLTIDLKFKAKAEDLLSGVVKASPFIETISIYIPRELWTHSQGNILRCLSPLPLRDLTVCTARPTPLTPENVVMIGQAWPALERFQMRSDDSVNPLQSPWGVLTGTPLATLLQFAETFSSNLKELHVDFTFEDQGHVPLPSEVNVRFKKLETLRFGAFRVFRDRYDDVGRFLAAICPPSVRLEMTPRGYTYPGGKHYEGRVETADNMEREKSRIAISEIMRASLD